MAKLLKLSEAVANAAADSVCAQLDSGYLHIYAGTRPADPDTEITSQTLLAELRFGASAFNAAVQGIALAKAITAEDDALATGTASFFRCLASDGTTPVFDGNVGTSDADMVLPTTSIAQHVQVSIDSFSYQHQM